MDQGKALVVDDHVPLTDNIIEILEESTIDLSVQCSVASSAAEALERAPSDLDLALIDLHLPDGQGTELIRALHNKAPHCQVVIITGDAAVEGAIDAMARGAFGYLLKPFKPARLLEVARRAIQQARLLREREALRLELERSEARHRMVIESVPAFVLALDHEDRILIWNRRLEEATGRSRTEMIGKPGRELIGAGGADVRLPMARGGHRAVRWQLALLADGRPTSEKSPKVFAVGIDVTEERAAQRRAMRAERLAAVGTLAAGLAHEVRNPLNSASLQLQVLERRVARGETASQSLSPVLNVVQDEIRRLDRLVSDFLAFARPVPIRLEPCALNDVVSRVTHLVQPECDGAHVSLSISLDPEAGFVLADEAKLLQVFLNILKNGIEAVGENGAIRVRTKGPNTSGNSCVEIEDDGSGFGEDAPIFDAFYTTKPHGTGLGLAIAHSIVQDHGGTITVDSQPGRTVFSVAIPEHTSG